MRQEEPMGSDDHTASSIPVNVPTKEPERPRTTSAASALHTVVLILMVVGVSALTAQSQHVFAERSGRIAIYSVTIGWEWLLFGYVCFGLRRHGVPLREIIGGRYKSP